MQLLILILVIIIPDCLIFWCSPDLSFNFRLIWSAWFEEILLLRQIYGNLLQLGHFPHLSHFLNLISLSYIYIFVRSLLFCFTYFTLSMYQLWSWYHITNRYFRRICDLSLFIEQRLEFIYEIIFIRFSLWFSFSNSLEKRKHKKLSVSAST